jgi:hypothetical protein
VGTTLHFRLGAGILAPAAEAVVCWTTLVHGGGALGLRLVSAGRARRAWRGMAQAAERSGAKSI